jgi:putative hydrolase of the HAD superfamily
MKNLLDIKYWIFDLDNTLYSGQTKVFSEVDKKMSTFISKKMDVDLVKAKEIQKKYFYEYGTTLSGLDETRQY